MEEERPRRRRRAAEPAADKRAGAPESVPPPVETERAAEQRPSQSARSVRPWGVVIDDLDAIEPSVEYAELRRRLVLGDRCDDYAAALHLADEAPSLLLRAVQLLRRARLDEGRVLDEIDDRMTTLRGAVRQAHAEELGKRAAQDRVEAVVRQEYPDEHERLRRRREEFHAHVRVCEGLVDAWKAKCRLIDTMLGKIVR